MQLQTYLKNISVSPKKLRFMLPDIKKMKPTRAVEKLFYAQQRSAHVLYKALQSAISNASRALKCDADLLKFKLFTIEQGQKLKRFRAGSRGTAKPVVHRYSHIKIILETDESINTTNNKVKKLEPVIKKEIKPKKIESKSEQKEMVGKPEKVKKNS